MSGMFDSTQVQLLQAMGYELWQRRGMAAPAPAVPPAVPPAEVPDAPAPATPTAVAAPAATDAPAAGAAAPRGLWAAVLAAAGLDAAAAERAGLRRAATGVAIAFRDDELWIDPQALRGDARTKRALWKTLRALRRAERGRGG
jgi:hypothetical protein